MSPGSLNINFSAILPEIILTALALVVLGLDFFLPKQHKPVLGYLSILGLVLLLPVVVLSAGTNASVGHFCHHDFHGLFKKD